MKGKIAIVVAVLAIAVAFVACSKSTTTSSLPKEEVAKVLPDTICSKMVECAPAEGGPTKDECLSKVTKQVLEGKNGQPFPTVTKKELDTCVGALKGLTCEQMQTNNAVPEGCSFLAQK